jgi:hypothetical protein
MYKIDASACLETDDNEWFDTVKVEAVIDVTYRRLFPIVEARSTVAASVAVRLSQARLNPTLSFHVAAVRGGPTYFHCFFRLRLSM